MFEDIFGDVFGNYPQFLTPEQRRRVALRKAAVKFQELALECRGLIERLRRLGSAP